MKEMKRILVVLVAVLMVSPVLFAASGPTTDSALWGNNSKGTPPTQTDCALWGNNSKGGPRTSTESAIRIGERIESPTQQRNPSDEGAYRQRIIDLMKSLDRGLGLLFESALWG